MFDGLATWPSRTLGEKGRGDRFTFRFGKEVKNGNYKRPKKRGFFRVLFPTYKEGGKRHKLRGGGGGEFPHNLSGLTGSKITFPRLNQCPKGLKKNSSLADPSTWEIGGETRRKRKPLQGEKGKGYHVPIDLRHLEKNGFPF